MPPTNALAAETSPYLLQHAANPVDWKPWGPAALAEARASGRPILLSIGYAACHWCHVMAHESFEDAEIAALMNRLFVNIKVDREERPDLDTIYQSALAMLGQQGGWPLTMFLTPDGEPFWGGTYFPPEPRYGRPGFAQVLGAVADTWTREPDKVGRNVEALRQSLASLRHAAPGGTVGIPAIDQVAARLVREIDPFHGGLGSAPKFPQPAILELLWRAFLRGGQEPFRHGVVLSVERMCQGGIYDHLGGGFARYSVDDEWLVPHFEKMLYDNAQLIHLMTHVWRGTRSPLLEARIRETVGWVLAEMVTAEGAFASSLDADSEGEEGRFYVWEAAEIDRLLGPGAARFKAVYDVEEGGNWEGRTILNRRRSPGWLGEEEAALAGQRAVLLAARAGRPRPGWDDKALADWNGLMIAALAEAAMTFGEPAWLTAALRAEAAIRKGCARDGRLLHAMRGGRAQHAATLDDHANLARAAIALCEATSDPAHLARALELAEAVERHFLDGEGGGYFLTADDAEALIVRTKSAWDQAVPAGNGTLLGVFARLFHLTADDTWRRRADRLVAAFSGELARNALALATFLNGAEALARASQVVIVGRRGEPATAALIRATMTAPVADRVMTVLEPGTALPPGHPAAGKTAPEGAPAAFLCRAMTCAPPESDPARLAELLRTPWAA